VDEKPDPADVGGAGVAREMEVAIEAGTVAAGFPGIGVEAESVANRSVVGVGAEVPRLHARSMSKTPIQKKICFFILFLV
jgi:hypothetical protein